MPVVRVVCNRAVVEASQSETITNITQVRVSVHPEEEFRVEVEIERVNPTTAKIETLTYPADYVIFEPCTDEDPVDDDWHVDW